MKGKVLEFEWAVFVLFEQDGESATIIEKTLVEILYFHCWDLRLNVLKIFSLWESKMSHFASINDLNMYNY